MVRGETVLMNAGASGLASVVIPMAKVFGARVITTVRSDETAASIAHLGADVIVNTQKQDVAEVLKHEAEAGHPLDLAIDCLGGEVVARCMPYMNRNGRWIIIATLASDIAPIDMKLMYKKSLRLIGNTLRARTPEVKAQILSNLVSNIWPKIESGQLRPTICEIMPIQQAELAHVILGKSHVGKVVLTVDDD